VFGPNGEFVIPESLITAVPALSGLAVSVRVELWGTSPHVSATGNNAYAHPPLSSGLNADMRVVGLRHRW
jgi:hypothetical protein